MRENKENQSFKQYKSSRKATTPKGGKKKGVLVSLIEVDLSNKNKNQIKALVNSKNNSFLLMENGMKKIKKKKKRDLTPDLASLTMTNYSNISANGFQSLVSSLNNQSSFHSLKQKLKSREKTLKQLRSTSQMNWSVTSLKAGHSSVRSQQHSSRKRSPVKKFLNKMRGFSKKKKPTTTSKSKSKTPRGLTSLKMSSKSPMT